MDINVDYAVYNIRKSFDHQPGQPSHCFYCDGGFTQSSVNPSIAVSEDLKCNSLIPVHEYSFLFVCDDCGWWLIRESWTYCECGVELDYVVAGSKPKVIMPAYIESETADKKVKPWVMALANPDLYLQSSELPEEFAALFLPALYISPRQQLIYRTEVRNQVLEERVIATREHSNSSNKKVRRFVYQPKPLPTWLKWVFNILIGTMLIGTAIFIIMTFSWK